MPENPSKPEQKAAPPTMAFRREKSAPVEETPAKAGGKGRPTPTRREAEAAAKARAKVPRTRKEQMQAQRASRADSTRKTREGMKSGDERYYLPRDRGPVRRFIRDYIDSRFSFVELVIPLLLVTLVLGYTGNPRLVALSSTLMLVTLVLTVTTILLLRYRVRKELARRFPDEPLKGTTYYLVTRAMQMRFMRMPKSKVKIGQELPERYR